jgi:hypothetical protein
MVATLRAFTPMMRLLPFCVAVLAISAAVAAGQDMAAPGKGGMMDKQEMSGKMDKTAKLDDSAPAKKGGFQFVEEVRPPRDPKPATAAIDGWVDAGLSRARIPSSPQADDAEFLRRVTLDIIGRIPTAYEASAFFESTDPGKRSRWIDDLLASPSYGEHFATIWRELMLPRDNAIKDGRDTFSPWLAEQFSRNRGWDRIVTDMLTAEGKLREVPQTGFIMANTDNGEPQPNLLADSTGRLFWGVQLRCAECHDHPFARWKQADFWGTAAFFSRTRKGYSEGKNPNGWTLTESAPEEPAALLTPRTWVPPGVAGPAILAPASAGKSAGKVIQAKYLGGADAGWKDDGPFRERFAQWAASAKNPWFAANAANRLWAKFFTRGLVMPLDGFNGENQPSHPELLAVLSRELVDSGFDLKHVIRCICHSRAYQRSSRVVAGNERDEKWFSHRMVKVMRPEMLYDSLSVALKPSAPKGGGKGNGIDRAQPLAGASREEFVRFFGSRPDENEGSTVNQGIPHLLRLMNGTLLNDLEKDGARLSANATDATDAVYLAAYSRRPTDEERRVVKEFAAAHSDASKAAAGLLWTLLNSAEFVTNH